MGKDPDASIYSKIVLFDHAVKKESVEAAEAKDRARKEADQKAKDEATKKLNDAWSANLGKPDADVAAPDEPAGDHVTATEPANTGNAF